MRILVVGANGFLGSHVADSLSSDHEVIGLSRSTPEKNDIKWRHVRADLMNREEVANALASTSPDAIINCAGIINPEQNVLLNETFTLNLLGAVAISGVELRRIIIVGSAAEYGLVDLSELPVDESVPLRASSGYGLAKVKEEEAAIAYSKEHNLPVVVVRLFNPIGTKMADKFLVSRLKRQIEDYVAGETDRIELHRKDSARDYVAIDDVVDAFRAILTGEPEHTVYNVGSGQSTSNIELLQSMIKHSKIEDEPKIIETSSEKEPLVAVQADITRIRHDLGWYPTHDIEDVIKEIMND